MDIQIKRGESVNFNGVTLLPGEPAFLLDEGKLYIGDGTDKVLINEDIPDVTDYITMSDVDTAITELDNNIKSRGYLTEVTSVDGGVF